MKTKYLLLFIFLIAMVFNADAQCAMCRAVLESEADPSQAKGVNNGIIYLMAIPYILVAVTVFYLYQLYKKKPEPKKN